MLLLSQKEVLKLKLKCIPLPQLKLLAAILGIKYSGSTGEIIKKILNEGVEEKIIDEFIKQKYNEKIMKRKEIISDDELKEELNKVHSFSWGIVQGQLDQKIQSEYVRKIVKYEDLVNCVKAKLHSDVTNYVICTWYNHWTTVLIEEHISLHKRVVPTIKNIKGIDIFFDGQPFDLKITYLPREFDPTEAIKNPHNLAVWLYENQGAQRFGADNRLFVVLLDKNNLENSWQLKRDFYFVFQNIDKFLDNEKISTKDEIVFTYNKKTYTAISKIIIIAK